MTPEALVTLTLLGKYGGVAPNDFAIWSDQATGLAACILAGWIVDTGGGYRMTFAGEAALYTGILA